MAETLLQKNLESAHPRNVLATACLRDSQECLPCFSTTDSLLPYHYLRCTINYTQKLFSVFLLFPAGLSGMFLLVCATYPPSHCWLNHILLLSLDFVFSYISISGFTWMYCCLPSCMYVWLRGMCPFFHFHLFLEAKPECLTACWTSSEK